jgi:hypothetical protein
MWRLFVSFLEPREDLIGGWNGVGRDSANQRLRDRKNQE